MNKPLPDKMTKEEFQKIPTREDREKKLKNYLKKENIDIDILEKLYEEHFHGPFRIGEGKSKVGAYMWGEHMRVDENKTPTIVLRLEKIELMENNNDK